MGTVRRITGADPAANVEVSDTVPVGANEVQTITGTPSGTFGIQIAGEQGPATLGVAATAAEVQTYLRAFSSIGVDGVTCSGGPLATTINVTFGGSLTAQHNMPAMAVVGSVTGLTFATTTQGTTPKSWVLLAVSVQMVQGITQTPWPSLIIDDGAVTIFQAFSGTAAMSASTTTQHTWAPNLQALGSAASTANLGPLPDGLVLPPGYRLRTSTTGLGANSNYGAPSYFVCELN
jgi:hypothetical protein